jgi:hypothetical protein
MKNYGGGGPALKRDRATEPVLISEITCPHCGTRRMETMPVDLCIHFYECHGCGEVLRTLPGRCCVFCSHGSAPCPGVQEKGFCCLSP